ncbi:MAG: hypothetical protein CXZ00_13395 [Acidobacteria bacterium]|nr:MAG: hypothetical protein CXZ00_13395 [Acidobacteriota bacterium]
MKIKRLLWVLLLPVCVFAQQYVTIDFPASLGTQCQITGINPGGTVIVGWCYDGVKYNGFRLKNGAFSTISFPGYLGTNWTTVEGVNDAETIVGHYYTEYPVHSTVYGMTSYSDGAYGAYVAPGPKNTWFFGINNKGEIVGDYQDWHCDGKLCNRRGFLLSKGAVTTLQFPGAFSTTIVGVNNLTVVVGNYEPNTAQGGVRSFTWSKGVFKEFTQVSGATLAGINDFGDMIGTTGSGAFLYSGSGAFYSIAYPGATSTSVSGLTNRSKNNTVSVVGNYWDSNNVGHGFYATVTLPRR